MTQYIDKCFAIKLPNITKDDKNNYNLNNNFVRIKKRVERGSSIKHFISEICMDMCNIVTNKGTKIFGNVIVDDLPEDEILVISFDQFSIQHKYIEYLKKSKDEKIKELESIISQERAHAANMRNVLLYTHNILGQQMSFLPSFEDENRIILENDAKRMKINDDGLTSSNYKNLERI